jgi:hypothetical protein
VLIDAVEQVSVEILDETADRLVNEALINDIFEIDNVLIDSVLKLPTAADICETLSVVVALITALAGSSRCPYIHE